jgi:hypothetical protein
MRRWDGTELTLEDRATRHRVAGLATLRAASARKTELLAEFAGFHRTQGIDQADVLLVPGPDSSVVRDLVESLQTQGVRVERATRPFRASARPHPGFEERGEFPIGTIRVPARQPRGRLAVTLLQPETLLGEDVTETYDITAWSLPYAYGVEAHSAGPLADGGFEEVPVLRMPVDWEPPAAGYGWLVLPSFRASGPVVRYVAGGGRAFALRHGFEQDGVMAFRGRPARSSFPVTKEPGNYLRPRDWRGWRMRWQAARRHGDAIWEPARRSLFSQVEWRF